MSCDYVPEADEQDEDLKVDEETGMYEIEYFSQPPSLERMQTRNSKKQQSEKLENSRPKIEVKDRRSSRNKRSSNLDVRCLKD